MKHLKLVLSLLFAAGTLTPNFPASENFVANPTLDNDLTGWETQSGSAIWSSLDANGSPVSGSALGTDIPNGPLTGVLAQCLPVVEHSFYEYGGAVFIPSGQVVLGEAHVRLLWFDDSDCLSFLDSVEVSTAETNAWVTLSSSSAAPTGANSVWLQLALVKPPSTPETFSAHFDDVILEDVVEQDQEPRVAARLRRSRQERTVG